MRGASASAAAVLTFAVFAGTAAAQNMRPEFGIAAARSLPIGDYHAAASGQGFNGGWQATALVSFAAAGWPVGVRVDGTYGTNRANEQLKTDLTTAFGQPSDESIRLLGANLNLVYPAGTTSRFRPYGVLGIGAHHVKVSLAAGDSTAVIAETKLAWNLGAGVVYRVRGMGPFLEARYVGVSAVSSLPRISVLTFAFGIRLLSR